MKTEALVTAFARRWVDIQIKNSETAKVAVLYASAYGNTAALAQAIARGVTKAGVGAEMINLEQLSLRDSLQVISESQGFVIGAYSPFLYRCVSIRRTGPKSVRPIVNPGYRSTANK